MSGSFSDAKWVLQIDFFSYISMCSFYFHMDLVIVQVQSMFWIILLISIWKKKMIIIVIKYMRKMFRKS